MSDENNDEIIIDDLPTVNPPMPDIPLSGSAPSMLPSEKTIVKMQDDAPAGTQDLIVNSIKELEEYAAQKKAITALEKRVFNKLKEHKIDAGPMRFVLKQRKLDMEYRASYDMQVRMIRSASGESQLALFSGTEEAPPKEVEKVGKSKKEAPVATGNPAAKKAVEATKKGRGRPIKVATGNRPELH